MFKLIRPITLKLRSLHGHTHYSTFPSSLLFSSYILSSPRGPLDLTNRIVGGKCFLILSYTPLYNKQSY